MAVKGYMTIDGIPVEIEDEQNILALVRKAGIDLPTFCYVSELSYYGACRMCMVEIEGAGLDSSCSSSPRPGMVVHTNTAKLRRYRKNILELLLANHCRECTSCEKSHKCRLQELALRFDLTDVRFPNTGNVRQIDASSRSIVRDESKCILCGDCIRMCNEVQAVGAIDFTGRGSKTKVSAVFGEPLGESMCVGCGQCAAVCPTGALTIKNDMDKVWTALDDKDTTVSVQVAPAVRVAISNEFGLDGNVNEMGLIIAALRRLGFNAIYDTALSADLTVMEESKEFLDRLMSGKGYGMPLFTSCCPGWIQYAEKNHPELLRHISTCKSPMEMFASIIKEEARKIPDQKHVHVAIMPCTAKKFEAARDEFKFEDGSNPVDYVLTSQELILMIREAGIVFSELLPEAADLPFGVVSGAGIIFGVTGGVTEAVLRRLSEDKSPLAQMAITFTGVRGLNGVKTTTINALGREIKIAVVSGLKNTSDLIKRIQQGEHFDFVEVMACPGGCVAGGGQPVVTQEQKAKRNKALYAVDKVTQLKRSEENPLLDQLYATTLKDKVHELLHVHYHPKDKAKH